MPQTIMNICAIAIILGALGRRIAGGGFQQLTNINVGDTPTRIFFGLMIAACALIVGIHWWLVLLGLTILTFIGSTTGNFNATAMGTGGNPLWKDFLFMSLHGFLSVVGPTIGAWYLGYSWEWILASGLIVSPCYMMGNLLFSVFSKMSGLTSGELTGWPAWLCQRVQFSEFIWGGLLGLGTVLAVLFRGIMS